MTLHITIAVASLHSAALYMYSTQALVPLLCYAPAKCENDQAATESVEGHQASSLSVGCVQLHYC